MQNGLVRTRLVAAVALFAVCGTLSAQTRVNYGRITAATLVKQQNRDAQAGGAVLGGMVGLASASRRSGGTAALRGVGGALAGQQIGRLASQRQAFEYTILIDGESTITMVSDEAGLRVGDCVAVERGAFNNLRLVDDSRCAPASASAAAAAPPNAVASDVQQADACIQAKERLFDAQTDGEFERAYRTVRLLCAD
jgi:outer membrane lipoprotein SlyB